MEPGTTAAGEERTGEERVLRGVLDAAGLAVATMDPEGRLTQATSAFTDAVAASDALCGSHLVSLFAPDDQAEVMAALVKVMEGAPATAHAPVRSRDGGRDRPMRLTLSSSLTEGRVALAAALVDRRDDRPSRQGAVEVHGAPRPVVGSAGPGDESIDSLLGSAVRRSARTGAPFALMALAVDPAPHGAVADALADRLSGRLRAGDRVCRDGRDVMVIAEDLGDEQDAAGVAYRLLSSVVEPVTVGDARAEMSLTVGVAVADGTAAVAALRHAARTALGAAVDDGRGGFRIVDLRSGRAA